MRSTILRAVRYCLDNFVEDSGFVLDGFEISRLMRAHNVTIRGLSERMGITQKRIREVRGSGLDNRNAARDWIEAITGKDPGPIAAA